MKIFVPVLTDERKCGILFHVNKGFLQLTDKWVTTVEQRADNAVRLGTFSTGEVCPFVFPRFYRL